MVASLDGRVSCFSILGHCDLDLFSRIIVSRAYLLYFLRKESQIWCIDASLNLCDLDQVSEIIVSGALFLILFEVVITNLVCGLLLGWVKLCIPFWVTLNLTFHF